MIFFLNYEDCKEILNMKTLVNDRPLCVEFKFDIISLKQCRMSLIFEDYFFTFLIFGKSESLTLFLLLWVAGRAAELGPWAERRERQIVNKDSR